MNIQSSCLSVSLLVSLWAGGVAPAIASPLSPLGEEGLALSSTSVSAMPINAAALAEQICGNQLSRKKRILVVCEISMPNMEADASAGALHLVSTAPVVTPCGLWDATLTLGARTYLHLANRETGQTVGFALRHGPGLEDPWFLAPIGESPKLFLHIDESEEGEEDDEVIRFEGCIPADVLKDPDVVVDPESQCEVCPEEEEPSSDPFSDPSSDNEADSGMAAPAMGNEL